MSITPLASSIRAVEMLLMRAPNGLHLLQRDVCIWLWDAGCEHVQFPDSAVFLTVTVDDTSFRSSSKLKFSICKWKNENIRRKYNTENQVLSCHKDVVSMKSVFFYIPTDLVPCQELCRLCKVHLGSSYRRRRRKIMVSFL